MVAGTSLVVAIEWECRVSRWLNLMAGIGNSIYMRHPAPVKDNSRSRTINPSILTSTRVLVSKPVGGFRVGKPDPETHMGTRRTRKSKER
jgi:hypothetical protein